ncbi:hypothetical protein DFJ73DRAFT_915636, partial [Zopfochytrium polystomum]
MTERFNLPPSSTPLCEDLLFDIPPIAGGFWRPDRAVGPDTFILTYNIPVWKGRMPFKPPTSDPPAANFFSLLTVRSLDAYLQEIPMTPNGVLALVHGDNGMMFGATTANISEAWPNQYPPPSATPTRSCPPRLPRSRAATSTLDPAVNGTAAIGGIVDRTGKSFEFPFAGDTVYCSTAWIVDAPANLALMLVLAVPSSDFLGPVNVTIRNTTIFVALFCVFALLLGVLLVVGAGRAAEESDRVDRKGHEFDFSTLQSDVAAGHSWIVEIAKLEGIVFYDAEKVGGVVGYMTISQAKATALTIAGRKFKTVVPITSVSDAGKLSFAPPAFRIMPHISAILPTIANGFWKPDRAAGLATVTKYPAVGNPNPLLSAAATEIVRRYSMLDPAVNGTAAISGYHRPHGQELRVPLRRR